MEGDEQVPWFDGPVEGRRIAADRLRDTWAMRSTSRGSPRASRRTLGRLRHVAWIGWAELPEAFATAGESYEGEVRLEVMGPGYSKWVWGPEGARASSRVPPENGAGWWWAASHPALTLKVEGDLAEAAVRVLAKRR